MELLRSLEKDRKRIEKDITTIVYYMNGGVSITEAWALSMSELNNMSTVITEHYAKQNDAMTNTKTR